MSEIECLEDVKVDSKDVLRLRRENKKLSKYNQELLDQIEVLTAKLHIHQRIDKSSFTSSSCQTEVSFRAYVKCPFCEQSVPEAPSTSAPKGWQNGDSDKSIAELVKEVATENVTANDYVYDEVSKTYASKSTGWYYYPDRKIFYNPHDKNFYTYNEASKSYDVYVSSTEASKKKPTKRTAADSEDSKPAVVDLCDDTSEEDGELLSDDSDIEEETRLGYDDVPPVRLIVLYSQSSDLECGSLLLACSVGSSIGRDTSCSINLPDQSVNKSHAVIKFNIDSQVYELVNGDSSLTYVNGDELQDARELAHGDIVEIGSFKLLAHIHAGKGV